MTEQNGTTNAPSSAALPTDQIDLHQPVPTDDWLEFDEHAAIRQQLGLRPRIYTESPDPLPCPPWCWHGSLGQAHPVNRNSPMNAAHASVAIDVAASCYHGALTLGPDDEEGTQTAAIRVRLRRVGQKQTFVRVALVPADEDQDRPAPIMLTVEDAEELTKVLGYLTARARAAEDLEQ